MDKFVMATSFDTKKHKYVFVLQFWHPLFFQSRKSWTLHWFWVTVEDQDYNFSKGSGFS